MVQKQETDKKNDALPSTVFKLDLHCEGCVRKFKHAVFHLDGVEDVKFDMPGNKVTVIGKVDPNKVRDKLADKSKKKVEIVSSPQEIDVAGDKPQPEKKKQEEEEEEEEEEQNKPDDKKPDDIKKTEEKSPKQVEAVAVADSPLVTLPGFGKSLVGGQLRVADSPSLLEDEEDSHHVDMAAEEFINNFYKDLKRQTDQPASFQSPYS